MPAPLPEPMIWLRAIVACASVVKFALEPVDAMPAPLPIPVTRLNATVVLLIERLAAPSTARLRMPPPWLVASLLSTRLACNDSSP